MSRHAARRDSTLATWLTVDRKARGYSDGLPVQPLMTGLGITYLDHDVLPGQVTRLYLLDYLQGALAIEVVDIKDAHHLPAYSQLVENLRFGPEASLRGRHQRGPS